MSVMGGKLCGIGGPSSLAGLGSPDLPTTLKPTSGPVWLIELMEGVRGRSSPTQCGEHEGEGTVPTKLVGSSGLKSSRHWRSARGATMKFEDKNATIPVARHARYAAMVPLVPTEDPWDLCEGAVWASLAVSGH